MEREDKNLKRSTVKCHSQYEEANFWHMLCNLVKMVVLIVFSVAEYIGLTWFFSKGMTKNYSLNFRFLIQDLRYCCERAV